MWRQEPVNLQGPGSRYRPGQAGRAPGFGCQACRGFRALRVAEPSPAVLGGPMMRAWVGGIPAQLPEPARPLGGVIRTPFTGRAADLAFRVGPRIARLGSPEDVLKTPGLPGPTGHHCVFSVWLWALVSSSQALPASCELLVPVGPPWSALQPEKKPCAWLPSHMDP